MDKKPVVDIYTDGACSGNPGIGGWACVLLCGNHKKELSGYSPTTTNNQMEIMAAIKAFEALKKPSIVNIYSDSAYLVNSFVQNWIFNWQKNGWKNAQNKEVVNKELFQKLFSLTSSHEVNWNKVKGHANNTYNNRCDELAVAEIKKHQ